MGACLCLCHWCVLHRHFGRRFTIDYLTNKPFDFCPPDQRSAPDLDPGQGPVPEEPEDVAPGHTQQVSGSLALRTGLSREAGLFEGTRA